MAARGRASQGRKGWDERARPAAPAPDAVEALDAAAVWALQRSIGNQAVGRLLAEAAPGDARARAAGLRHGGIATSVARAGAMLQRGDDVTRSNVSETTDTGNQYTQELVLNKTQKRIRVQLGVNWVKKGTWANDAAFQAFIRTVKTAAYSYLDNKFKVVCTPNAPGAGASPIELPIEFLIYDFSSGYQIEAHGGTPGGDSFMSQSGGEVYEYQSDGTLEEAITYAHEFGHALLGASDEYVNPKVPGRVLTNDHSIMANYYAQGKTAAEFKARHFQHIVTEVAKAFAGYTCRIEKM